MKANKMATPIYGLRIEQRKYYTQIYLGVTLLFSIHHVAGEYADSGEKLNGLTQFYITEIGIAAILIPGNKRNYITRKRAERACIQALKEFRAALYQLDL